MIFTVFLNETEVNNFNNSYEKCKITKMYLKQLIAIYTTEYDQKIMDSDNHKDSAN
jgi:hypothetical protein